MKVFFFPFIPFLSPGTAKCTQMQRGEGRMLFPYFPLMKHPQQLRGQAPNTMSGRGKLTRRRARCTFSTCTKQHGVNKDEQMSDRIESLL